MRSAICCLIVGLLIITSSASGEEKVDERLLELAVGDQKYQGRQYLSDDSNCWLLEQDGRLRHIDLPDVTGFRKISNSYKPFSQNEMRSRLLKEYGRTTEVEIRGLHLVVAPLGKARMAAEIVEATSKSFVSYFTRRNLKLEKQELPLVTVVFATQKEFLSNCQKEKVKRTSGLRGFYSPTTNQVALYLEQPNATAAKSIHGDLSEISLMPPAKAHWQAFRQESFFGAPQGPQGFADTLVHETTHQMGFNTGLHSRLGDDPVWVVEGLAMLFEGDANRDDARSQSTTMQRINRERFMWFQEYNKLRRKSKSLEEFLTTDGQFETAALDAYSEAWALMFFLAETRSSQLNGYLKKLAHRTETGEYTPMRRLSDFRSSFGKDLNHLEAQYLRFITDLELPASKPTSPQKSQLEEEYEKGKAELPPVTIR